MKKLLLSALLLAGLALQIQAQAQDIEKMLDNPKVRKELALTDQEEKSLRELWETTRQDLKLAHADREVKTSELKRLMLESKVNMPEVQKILRETLEIEYKTRLSAIERMVKAREILGEERWAKLHTYLRGLRGRMNRKNGMGGNDDAAEGNRRLGPRGNRF